MVATIGLTMGQSIVVNEKPSPNPGVVRFETNRALSGMGHERYRAGTEVWGDRPTDELARRLLARGGVSGVQINGNMVTVDLEKGHDSDGLKVVIENLYRFYPDQASAALAGGSAVADAPSPEAAGSPEMAAVPADGTATIVEDAPSPDEPDSDMSDQADVAPTDELAGAGEGSTPTPADDPAATESPADAPGDPTARAGDGDEAGSEPA
ncbi:hypothetical protein BH20ACT3_BH20ACT3_16990 [soil metagenome]